MWFWFLFASISIRNFVLTYKLSYNQASHLHIVIREWPSLATRPALESADFAFSWSTLFTAIRTRNCSFYFPIFRPYPAPRPTHRSGHASRTQISRVWRLRRYIVFTNANISHVPLTFWPNHFLRSHYFPGPVNILSVDIARNQKFHFHTGFSIWFWSPGEKCQWFTWKSIGRFSSIPALPTQI